MIHAQEAYEKVCKQLESIDITEDLALIEKNIEESIEHNYFIAYSQPFRISDVKRAEKIAIYLQKECGYNASVISGPNIQVDGAIVSTAVISINWKFIPANIRESLNTRF
jgi:hypothetical protein